MHSHDPQAEQRALILINTHKSKRDQHDTYHAPGDVLNCGSYDSAVYVVLEERGWTNMILNLHKDMEENFSGHCFVDDFYQTGNLGSVCLDRMGSQFKIKNLYWFLDTKMFLWMCHCSRHF